MYPTNSQRFCVLEEHRRQNLTSEVLATTLRRLSADFATPWLTALRQYGFISSATASRRSRPSGPSSSASTWGTCLTKTATCIASVPWSPERRSLDPRTSSHPEGPGRLVAWGERGVIGSPRRLPRCPPQRRSLQRSSKGRAGEVPSAAETSR